jgi:hypothetical protein
MGRAVLSVFPRGQRSRGRSVIVSGTGSNGAPEDAKET